MLIKMNIRYGDKKAIDLCDKIGYEMANQAIKSSALLAGKYGTYPMYNQDAVCSSKFFIENTDEEAQSLVHEFGLNNSQILTIAPTGTLSTMIGVSGGIEPIFANYYTRKTESLSGHDEYYKVYTPIVKQYMQDNGLMDDSELPEFFITAQNLNYKERIDMQSIWQKHIDASISSTVNVSNDFTIDDTEKLYLYAWEKGLKGVTIYRDGCKRSGILTTDKTKTTEKESGYKLNSIVPITRSELGVKLNGHTYVKNTACGKIYITINRDADDNLVEVFIDSGKSGGCSANAEALGRYASACLRAGMKVESVIDIAKGVKCAACTKVKGKGDRKIDGLSCSDIIARVIEEEYKSLYGDTNVENKIKPKADSKLKNNSIKLNDLNSGAFCPECGAKLQNEGGCVVCRGDETHEGCGWSKCG